MADDDDSLDQSIGSKFYSKPSKDIIDALNIEIDQAKVQVESSASKSRAIKQKNKKVFKSYLDCDGISELGNCSKGGSRSQKRAGSSHGSSMEKKSLQQSNWSSSDSCSSLLSDPFNSGANPTTAGKTKNTSSALAASKRKLAQKAAPSNANSSVSSLPTPQHHQLSALKQVLLPILQFTAQKDTGQQVLQLTLR